MTCNNCIHGELCMGRTDTTPFTKTEYRDLYNVEKFCEDFKNKADFVEVVRCKNCVKAIKEFAERLKEVGTKVEGGKGFEGVFVMVNNLQIDNLVTELTESE